MSDYTKSYNGAAKDAATEIIYGTDFDTEFQAIETAVASKANKVIPAASGNVAALSVTGDLTDSSVTSTELSILDGATVTTAELNVLDGITSTTAELNILDGVTSTAAELNILDGVTSTTAELNVLDGITATTTELNYTSGVTSAIQTQLDAKAASTTWTLIDSWTPTATNSKDFTWDESVYSSIKVVIRNVIPASDGASFYLYLGYGNGGTFFTTSGDYLYSREGFGSAGTYNTPNGVTTGGFVQLSTDGAGGVGVGTSTAEGFSGEVDVIGASSVVNGPAFNIHNTFKGTSNNFIYSSLRGFCVNAVADSNQIDSVRLAWSSGNFETTGSIYVYGLKVA